MSKSSFGAFLFVVTYYGDVVRQTRDTRCIATVVQRQQHCTDSARQYCTSQIPYSGIARQTVCSCYTTRNTLHAYNSATDVKKQLWPRLFHHPIILKIIYWIFFKLSVYYRLFHFVHLSRFGCENGSVFLGGGRTGNQLEAMRTRCWRVLCFCMADTFAL